MKTNASINDLQAALDLTNLQYDDNVLFNRLDQTGNRVTFTLRVADSSGPGHRVGFHRTNSGNRRKLSSACWHVHGNFFENLFKVWSDAWVRTGTHKIDITEGNWQDRQIDSMADPLYFSEACECE